MIETKSKIVDTSIKQAAKGTSLVIAGTVVSTFLLLIIKILIARNTTKEELGVYTLCVGVLSVLSLIATLGAHEGIARYVALLLGKGDATEADLRSRSLGDFEANQSIGNEARRWVENNIGSWHDCANRYIQAYHDLLEVNK